MTTPDAVFYVNVIFAAISVLLLLVTKFQAIVDLFRKPDDRKSLSAQILRTVRDVQVKLTPPSSTRPSEQVV